MVCIYISVLFANFIDCEGIILFNHGPTEALWTNFPTFVQTFLCLVLTSALSLSFFHEGFIVLWLKILCDVICSISNISNRKFYLNIECSHIGLFLFLATVLFACFSFCSKTWGGFSWLFLFVFLPPSAKYSNLIVWWLQFQWVLSITSQRPVVVKNRRMTDLENMSFSHGENKNEKSFSSSLEKTYFYLLEHVAWTTCAHSVSSCLLSGCCFHLQTGRAALCTVWRVLHMNQQPRILRREYKGTYTFYKAAPC